MAPDHNPVSAALPPPTEGVTVRMYNTGFGDCLLLAFRAEDGTGRYMLIDCGAHHQVPGRAERLRKVAEDIVRATGSHLHLVVATHEHTDHLLGFADAQSVFDRCQIDNLWLAWTEDPADPLARKLKEVYGLRLRGLQAAVRQIALNRPSLADKLQAILDFEIPVVLGAGERTRPIDYLRAKSATKPESTEHYRRPGQVLGLPDVPNVNVYVLGPPRSQAWLRTLEKKGEHYPELAFLTAYEAFAAAALAADSATKLNDDDRELIRRSRPFDPVFEIPESAAATHPDYGGFFCRAYGFSSERGHGPSWRRIEADWLASAESLALQINAKTNNTSLVLAIELGSAPPRQVLLFAADAQAGNWLSWQEVSWSGAGAGDGTVSAADLLQRTVLYKVGHHGSRNATLSIRGLEMMTHPGLVALLPVDQEWAHEKQGWEHPAEKLYKRLRERARGRIVRTDQIPAGDEPPACPPEASEADWQAFVERLDWDRSPDSLWIQYTTPAWNAA